MQSSSEKGHYKKYAVMGPGGKKCSCCYPPPGKTRRYFERQFFRQFLQDMLKQSNKENSTP